MPVKGIARTRKALRIAVKSITGAKTEAAIRAIFQEAGASADQMTPIDTSTLVNSRYAPIITVAAYSTFGRAGYTAEYAAAVHESPGTSRGKGIPRDPNDPTRGNYWDPNAEPGYYAKGFKKITPDIPKILKAVYGV